MRIANIRYAGKADVYNMEVAGVHDYAIENGTIVHNCRYVIVLTKPKIKTEPAPPQKYRPDPLDMRKAAGENETGVLLRFPEVQIGGR